MLAVFALLVTGSGANGCYDNCCFAPECPRSSQGVGQCPPGHTRKMQSCAPACCVPDDGAPASSCCKLGPGPGPKPSNGSVAIPTPIQVQWQDMEIGSLNSFQMVTFYPPQLKPSRPFTLAPASAFTPWKADTDQWAEAVASMGGKYAVLNVKDESGFLLYDTACHGYNYTIRHSPVWPTVGDITARFVESCRRVGVRPGIYYLVWGNFFANMTNSDGVYDCSRDTPQTRAYESMVLCQLEELFIKYGPFAEIWNDGGAPCRPEFEDAIANLTAKYQPQSVIFQGPTRWVNDVRWVGTEEGTAPYDTWSSADSSQDYGAGRRDGAVFAPAEADTCIRTASCPAPGGGSNGCWVWCPNSTDTVKSLATLQNDYLTTVGRNANFFLNLSPNTDGTVDPADMSAYKALGAWLTSSFRDESKLSHLENQTLSDVPGQQFLDISIPRGSAVRYIEIKEDQTDGQRIWGWEVLGRGENAQEAWTQLFSGGSIGHKRILDCGEAQVHCGTEGVTASFRFNVTAMASKEPPRLRSLTVYAATEALSTGSAAVSV